MVAFYHDHCPMDCIPACDECGAKYDDPTQYGESRPGSRFFRCPLEEIAKGEDHIIHLYYAYRMDECPECREDSINGVLCSKCVKSSLC